VTIGIILILLVLPLVLDSVQMAGRFGDGKILIEICYYPLSSGVQEHHYR
jgi:hypothetical protein